MYETFLFICRDTQLPCLNENKNSVSPELVSEIKRLLKLNKEAHIAYTQGAMFGLFTKIGLPGELGWKIGKDFSRQQGRNVALASKLAGDVAREEEGKVKLRKL